MKKTRLFQFSVGSLLVGVFAASLILRPIARRIEENRACSKINETGAFIFANEDGNTTVWIGAFSNYRSLVTTVNIEGNKDFQAEQLETVVACANRLGNVRELIIVETKLTDRDFFDARLWPGLRKLTIRSNQLITDSSVERILENCTSLQRLELYDCPNVTSRLVNVSERCKVSVVPYSRENQSK